MTDIDNDPELFDEKGRITREAKVSRQMQREAEAILRKRQGIEDVAALSAEWRTAALAELEVYLRDHPRFFVDDFWTFTKLDKPHDSRALGPVVQQAARKRWIVKSGHYRSSIASNMSEKPVWLSQLYQGDGDA